MIAFWQALLEGIRIQDILDIGIIAILIYSILVWFKHTAFRFVLVGITFLGIVYVLSRFFQLYLTAVVLQGFFTILLIALVVIFQEELRRFFERIAMWGKFSKKSLRTHDYRIDLIENAVKHLAFKRFGALIVIQGEEPLDRHIDGGIRLDGILSEALLLSIFDPHSVGHDGAVIIKGGRVMQFACRLPLAENPRIGTLGLRHTAAIGLSERSDALCIVVSEERNTISVARRGQLTLVANADELEDILKELYSEPAPQKATRHFSGWLMLNFWEKIGAIALALILWISFGYQRDSIRRDFAVPIEYRNLPARWGMEEPKINNAKVTLTGSQQAFRLFDPTTLKISLDLSELEEGKQDISFTRDMIRTPSNLSLAGIEPKSIQLTAYSFMAVQAPIKVVVKNGLENGKSNQKLEAIPSFVSLLVPPKLQKQVIKVETEPIALEQFISTTTVIPRLILPPGVRYLDDKIPSVKIVIKDKIFKD